MSKEKLLKKLADQIICVHQDIEASKKLALVEPRFDKQLFKFIPQPHTAHDLLNYLSEINFNFNQLEISVEQNNSEFTHYLAEKIIAQLTALKREIATQDLRQNIPKIPIKSLAQRKASYLQYQKNLIAKKQAYQKKHQQCCLLEQKKQIEIEIAKIDNKLYRCQKTITVLENTYH